MDPMALESPIFSKKNASIRPSRGTVPLDVFLGRSGQRRTRFEQHHAMETTWSVEASKPKKNRGESTEGARTMEKLKDVQ